MTEREKKKILVIEDDHDICELVGSRLQSAGFDVMTASDGEEGLRQAKRIRPDLVVLDLMLPKMTGEEVCKAIRECDDEELIEVPIVMFTDKDGLADQIIGKVIGATAYVVKPQGGGRLLEKILGLLSP